MPSRTLSLCTFITNRDSVVENFAKYMPNHKPLWTCVQVEMLGEKEMEIEIEVIAHVPRL